MNEDKIQTLLYRPEFPRSNAYDPAWVLENQMGPNALWLVEWLTRELDIKSGMRVLDLGCGKAMTSIFLAREFGVQVWAADLWITPDHNQKRAEEAGVQGLVFPFRAEAHSLPFAADFFDAVISIDAYQYFGTDILYLQYLLRFVRQNGQVGVVVPGLMREVESVPEHLARPQANGKVFWEDECWCFQTADWWRRHWGRNSGVGDLRVDTLPDGWRLWRDFERALETSGKALFPSDAEALEHDRGEHLGFVRARSRKIGETGLNFYDPAIGIEVGVDR
ncbi:MAG: methyltransferase domain-containing protein [Deltaproteobacteria bacterium]|nr:methyltransferase domain-containing protein [Deltaproteobacteria bacterium]